MWWLWKPGYSLWGQRELWLGQGPRRGYSGWWLAKFYFLICAVVTRAFALKYSTRLHISSYSVLLLFYNAKVKKPHTHKSDHVTALLKPFNSLPMLVIKVQAPSHGGQGLAALGSLLKASTLASLLPTLNFQFLKSTLLSYVTASEHQLLLLRTIKHTLSPSLGWFLFVLQASIGIALSDAPMLDKVPYPSVFPTHCAFPITAFIVGIVY